MPYPKQEQRSIHKLFTHEIAIDPLCLVTELAAGDKPIMRHRDIRIILSIVMLFIAIQAFIFSAPLLLLLMVPVVWLNPSRNSADN